MTSKATTPGGGGNSGGIRTPQASSHNMSGGVSPQQQPHDGHTDSAPPPTTTLRNHVSRRVGGTAAALCVVGIIAIGLNYYRVFRDNDALSSEWAAIGAEADARDRLPAGSVQLSADVATQLRELGYSVALTVAASVRAVADVGSSSPIGAYSHALGECLHVAGATSASTPLVLEAVLNNGSCRIAAMAAQTQLNVASGSTRSMFCVSVTGPSSTGGKLVTCVAREVAGATPIWAAASVNSAGTVVNATAATLSSSSTSGAAVVPADVIRFVESTASISADATAAPTLAGAQATNPYVSGSAAVSVQGVPTPVVLQVNVSIAGVVATVIDAADAAFEPLACATESACGSFIALLDQTSRACVARVSVISAGAPLYVTSAIPSAPGAVVLNQLLVSNASAMIEAAPSAVAGGAASHALRFPLPTAPEWSVVVGFDPREVTAAARGYAESATDVVDRSLIAATSVAGAGCVLLVIFAVATAIRANVVGRAIAEPLERVAEDFRNASVMRLTHVTAYCADDVVQRHSKKPGDGNEGISRVASEEALGAQGSSGKFSPNSAQFSPHSHSIHGSTEGSPKQRSFVGPPKLIPPLAPYSDYAVVALVQQRTNAMAIALERCAKFLPRTVFRGGAASAAPNASNQASPKASSGLHAASESPAAPDVDDVFAPRVSTVNEPPRLELISGGLESPRPEESPEALDQFRFGASQMDAAGMSGDFSQDEGILTPTVHDVDFGLRRTTVSVLHLTFAGFLKLAQDMSLQEAHSVSQVFLTVSVRIIERHAGVVVHVAADKITASWNAFGPMANHESRAAACAFDLRTALSNSEQDMWLPDLHWCACVASGDVVVGNSGTESDRAPVMQGPCVDVATELPPLMIAIGVQVAISESVRARLQPMRDRKTPWYSLPVDRVTLANGETEVSIYELRHGEAPKYAKCFEGAFESLMDGQCQDARLGFHSILDGELDDADDATIAPEHSSSTQPGMEVSSPAFAKNTQRPSDVAKPQVHGADDVQALRLMKLSTLFGSLGVSYVRALPAWQRFEFDAVDQDEAAPQRERRHIAEKRKSIMPDDVLRTELMNLHNLRVAKQSSPKAAVTGQQGFNGSQRRLSAMAGPQMGRRRSSVGGRRVSVAFVDQAPAAAGEDAKQEQKPEQLSASLLTAENGGEGPPAGFNRGRRGSKKPFTDAATFTLNAAAAATGTPAQLSAAQLAVPGAIAQGSNTTTPSAPSQQQSPMMAGSGSPLISMRVPALLAGVVEFRDRKNMLFRVSRHLLGRGAAGEVLLGISETGCLVAVKNVPVPKQTAGTEELTPIQRRRMKRKGVNVSANVKQDVENLLTEVSLLARLRDEHIVGYLSSAILEEGSQLAVVMEYISGGSLQSLLQEFEGMPLRTVKRYLRDILKGLTFLHAEQIIHRDLKPHNVLLLIDGSCKLTDFGTSSTIGKIAGTTDVQGTPQYMSPEACRGETLQTSSDIWSFGVLMAQLVTGNLPWKDDGMYVPIRFMYQVGNMETMVPEVPDSCPDAARDIILECCQRDASLRPTAEELLTRPFFNAAPTPMRTGRSGSRAGSHRSRASGDLSPFTPNMRGGHLRTASGGGGAASPNSRARSSDSPSSRGSKTPLGQSANGSPNGLVGPVRQREPSTSFPSDLAGAAAAAAAVVPSPAGSISHDVSIEIPPPAADAPGVGAPAPNAAPMPRGSSLEIDPADAESTSSDDGGSDFQVAGDNSRGSRPSMTNSGLFRSPDARNPADQSSPSRQNEAEAEAPDNIPEFVVSMHA